jgi:acetyltransferase-like isoleucine patch superfamily enzyme
MGQGSNIIDMKGKTQPPVVVGDDTYEGLDAVLLAGETLATISNEQLVYLRSTVAQGTPDFQLITGEWAYRVGRKAEPSNA